MDNRFDRRVLPDSVLGLIRAVQRRVPAHLGGGAALSGASLGHRLSADIDIFCHQPDDVRTLVRELPAIATECGATLRIVRDAGTFVRASATLPDASLEVDLVHESNPDIGSAEPIEGIAVESLIDLRANKLTCILSRSEPRDLVDLLFLDRAGYPPEHDLEIAARKDGGIDPGILAWLLGQFPVKPLPRMLEPLGEDELLRFRDALRERLKAMSVPAGEP